MRHSHTTVRVPHSWIWNALRISPPCQINGPGGGGYECGNGPSGSMRDDEFLAQYPDDLWLLEEWLHHVNASRLPAGVPKFLFSKRFFLSYHKQWRWCPDMTFKKHRQRCTQTSHYSLSRLTQQVPFCVSWVWKLRTSLLHFTSLPCLKCLISNTFQD